VRFQRVVELVKRVPVFAGSIPWGDTRSRNGATELLGALGWPLPVPARLV
jgi:hypothetical protein